MQHAKKTKQAIKERTQNKAATRVPRSACVHQTQVLRCDMRASSGARANPQCFGALSTTTSTIDADTDTWFGQQRGSSHKKKLHNFP